MIYNLIDTIMANIKNGRIPLGLLLLLGCLNLYARYLIVSCLIAGALTYAIWKWLTKGTHS